MDPNTFNYYSDYLYTDKAEKSVNYNTYLAEENTEKPWMRASKDSSLIVKGTELFVGNLSIETTEQDIYDVFKDYGEVIDVKVSF